MQFIPFIWTVILSYSGLALEMTDPTSLVVEGVTIHRKASFAEIGKPRSLTLVGAGLRAKKVVFVTAKVYVAQLFAENPNGFDRANPLTKLSGTGALAMRMQFLRSVDGDSLAKAFQSAFKENDLENESIQKFLQTVKDCGGVQEKASVIVKGWSESGKDWIVYQIEKGPSVKMEGPVGFMNQVFALWLGKPSDSGVETLKASLLKEPVF